MKHYISLFPLLLCGHVINSGSCDVSRGMLWQGKGMLVQNTDVKAGIPPAILKHEVVLRVEAMPLDSRT